MKSLPGGLKLLIFAAMGVGAIVGVRAIADCTTTSPQGTFTLAIRPEAQVKDENTFSDIFDPNNHQLSSQAQYCLHMRHSPQHQGHGPYAGKTEYDITNMPSTSNGTSQLDITTDAVTVSDKALTQELTAITTHTTVRIASPSSVD